MTSSGAGDGSSPTPNQSQVAADAIRQHAPPGDHLTESDPALYRAYAGDGAQEAFSALVRRHSAMVLCVARRVCGAGADAEDVLQATFLALASHAQARKPIAHLASWLHRVARNLATHRRDAVAARRWHERQAGEHMSRRELRAEDHIDPDAGARITAAMDQALDELPARYRQPLILHYLEGQSFDQIAHALDTSTGTVASWLSRGRALLRERLTRHGHPLSSATLVLVLGDLAREHGSATLVEVLDPTRLGTDGHGSAIRELASHAEPIAGRLPWLGALALALATVLSATGLWTLHARVAGSTPLSTRRDESARATPSPAAPSARRIDLDTAGVAFYRYLSVDNQTVAAAQAMVAGLPLAEIGSWPGDEPDPWAVAHDPEMPGMPFRRGDETPYIARLATGDARLGPARVGARNVLALWSEVVSDAQRWNPELLTKASDDFALDIGRWDLLHAPAEPNHRYLFLLDLGTLSAGAHVLDIVEHLHLAQASRLRSRLAFQVADAAAAVDAAVAVCDRSRLTPAPDRDPPRAYCQYRVGILSAHAAPASWGLISAGGLPPDAMTAPIDALSIPVAQASAEDDDMRCVVIASPVTTEATSLRVRALIPQADGARLIVEAWSDPATPAVAPRVNTLVAWFARGPGRITLEWHALRRMPDGGYEEITAPTPRGEVTVLPIPEHF